MYERWATSSALYVMSVMPVLFNGMLALFMPIMAGKEEAFSLKLVGIVFSL